MIVTWTIYDHPKDAPDVFVMRKFIGETPTQEAYGHADIDRLRDVLIHGGFVCISRSENDDPVIVETWL